MGKSRGRHFYDDEYDSWQEKEKKFNRRREKRNVRSVANAVNNMIKSEDENA